MMKSKLAQSGVGVAATIVILTALLGGDLAWSYWQGMQGIVRDSLRDATSIQFDLARLDQAIEDLTPTLQENRKLAAELDVEIDFLASNTQQMEEKQRFALAEMQELRDSLDSNTDTIYINDQSFDRATVESDLLRRMESYELKERQLETRRNLLAKRRQTLAQAVTSIQGNEHEQRMLADLADSLNAELKLLEVATATSKIKFDQPELANTQELATKIRKRIQTMQRMYNYNDPGHKVQVSLDRRTARERFDVEFAKQ